MRFTQVCNIYNCFQDIAEGGLNLSLELDHILLWGLPRLEYSWEGWRNL